MTRIVLGRDTEHHRIRVFEKGGLRVLAFDRLTQGFLPVGRPVRRRANYTDGLAFALGALAGPIQDVVIVGLGAAMLQGLLAPAGIRSTTIELDPEVVDLAREFFAFEPDENTRVLVGDGRRVLEREIGRTDAILLDAFSADGVPEHLATRDFFELCSARLTSGGIFVGNFVGALTGARNGHFWTAVKALEETFPGVVVLQDELAGGQTVFFGNAIVIATKGGVLSRTDLRNRAFDLARRLARPELMLWAPRFFAGPYPPGATALSSDAD